MRIHQLRSLWLAYALLASAFVGTAGGVLAFLAGDNSARAVIAGGATFAAATTVAILILTFIAPASDDQ